MSPPGPGPIVDTDLGGEELARLELETSATVSSLPDLAPAPRCCLGSGSPRRPRVHVKDEDELRTEAAVGGGGGGLA